MGQAYTPTLSVSSHTKVSKLRELPLFGSSLVEIGQRVASETPVLSAELPGEVEILRIADRLGLDVCDVLPGMKVKAGEQVEVGQLLCEVKTFFNLATSSLESPVSASVEFFTENNAHLGLRLAPTPISVDAYIDGVVVEMEPGKSVLIETDASLIQGIFGVGGERRGKIVFLPDAEDLEITPDILSPRRAELSESVLVGGSCYSKEALSYAADSGVSAVMTGSVSSEVLSHFLGYQLGVSVTGDEDVPFTFIVTEGFGRLSMSKRVSELAREIAGRRASVNGATQVRAGAMRPEVIAPFEGEAKTVGVEELKTLEIGAPVRVVRVPHFGEIGTIVDLPSEPTRIPSGALVRILVAKLENGEEVSIPRANVELL